MFKLKNWRNFRKLIFEELKCTPEGNFSLPTHLCSTSPIRELLLDCFFMFARSMPAPVTPVYSSELCLDIRLLSMTDSRFFLKIVFVLCLLSSLPSSDAYYGAGDLNIFLDERFLSVVAASRFFLWRPRLNIWAAVGRPPAPEPAPSAFIGYYSSSSLRSRNDSIFLFEWGLIYL